MLARRLLNELHHIHAVEAVQGAAEAIRRRCHCHSSRFSPDSGVFSHYSTRNGEKQYIPRNFDGCSLPCPASFPIFLLYFVQTICYNNGCKCAGGSMDRASDSGSEGWGFESLPACHLRIRRADDSFVGPFVVYAGKNADDAPVLSSFSCLDRKSVV